MRSQVKAIDFAIKLKGAVKKRRSTIKKEVAKKKEVKKEENSSSGSECDDWQGSQSAQKSTTADISRGLAKVDYQPGHSEPAAREKCYERPHDKRMWTIAEIFEVEAGKPSIIDGFCALCAEEAGTELWGNPFCRGCSIVDSLSFQYHPFRILLQEWPHGKPRLAPAVAEIPSATQDLRHPKPERCNLPPPLLGSLGQMYREEFGFVG
jgi:hypothetical protein